MRQTMKMMVKKMTRCSKMIKVQTMVNRSLKRRKEVEEEKKNFSSAAAKFDQLLDGIEDTLAEGCHALAEIAFSDGEAEWIHVKNLYYNMNGIEFANRFKVLRARYYLLSEQLKERENSRIKQNSDLPTESIPSDPFRLDSARKSSFACC